MAVQAQYPSNVFFNRRSLQEDSEKVVPSRNDDIQGQIQSSNMTLFNSNGNENDNIRNQQKRARYTSSPAPVNIFSSIPHPLQQPQLNTNNNNNNKNISYSNNQNLLISTGLNLSSSNHRHQINHSLNINHQDDDINQLLLLHGEQLRRALSDNRRRQCRTLLTAAEESVLHRLKEMQVKVENAVRHNVQLEARATQLSMEAQLWQAKARTQEAAAASLQAQIQQATMINDGAGQATDHEDAESVYVDPDRVVEAERSGPVCKACRRGRASVVLLPCRHLCVCAACDGVVSACPYCFTVKNSSVQAFLP